MLEQIIFLVTHLRIRDIIDVAIVAFVFYKLFMLIKATRAEQVLKGLAVLLVVTKVSEWLDLYTINYLLRNAMTVGVIAILIVFQPELRRGLEQLGRGKFFDKNFFKLEKKHSFIVIKEIVKAVETLSQNKIGALIVIERKTGLSDIIQTGVKIQAVVSKELLCNIFVPNTPLHDGAVLIREDEIVAAGCFLPLTENPNLSKQLGTRHRAALGISENSDGIAIIVSEETGIISLASDGKLTRYLDSKSLEDILTEVYREKETTNPISTLKWRIKNE
ncbi:MAG: diadenylate cyclase CdaA [Clostridia bacterium]|nr:diadenylate cyclase CdaA [Clostridia bacterium]